MKTKAKQGTALYILVLLAIPFSLRAQTVNTGDVIISEGTVVSIVPEFDNTATGTFINHGDVYAYNNWNNDGSVDHTLDSGITRFVGNDAQLISGANYNFLYDVLFNNASAQPAFMLTGGFSIANESSFENGIVDNDNFGGEFIFEQNSDQVLTTNDSHVDGPVVKMGDNSFEFPIGDAGFHRWAAISAPDTSADQFVGKYFFEDTNTNYPVANVGPNLELIDNAEHWTIERTTGNSDVLVTLSWDNDTTPAAITQLPAEGITIARWDEAQNLWIDEGAVVDATAQTVTTAVDAYGVFTLARAKTDALPCALTVFNLITPDGDGINDFLDIRQAIDDVSCANNVNVKIFNRWGVKVFEQDDYDESANTFKGFSDARATIDNSNRLPTGTYFYILTFDYQGTTDVRAYKKAGYLYINGN
ncbi:gliding motility-associated C-terminal domain-containing protein [Spongiimicrobium sp. 3-5]|uniref:gliding motility-associated C-terminal domain-containing protein n=1 Tax=Spongiimicrobium sp. 3-5 TaxID=3332596 RepID=UPI00397F8B83